MGQLLLITRNNYQLFSSTSPIPSSLPLSFSFPAPPLPPPPHPSFQPPTQSQRRTHPPLPLVCQVWRPCFPSSSLPSTRDDSPLKLVHTHTSPPRTYLSTHTHTFISSHTPPHTHTPSYPHTLLPTHTNACIHKSRFPYTFPTSYSILPYPHTPGHHSQTAHEPAEDLWSSSAAGHLPGGRPG